MQQTLASPLWYASGLRWIARFFEALADRLERTFGAPVAVTGHDLYFDSDAYLAQVRADAIKRYY